jgi:hypothetical protein
VLDLFDRCALCKTIAGHDAAVNLATHIPRSTLRMLLPGAWRENDRIRREASAHLVDAAPAAGVADFADQLAGRTDVALGARCEPQTARRRRLVAALSGRA